jgi:signal transduction histidine kinase
MNAGAADSGGRAVAGRPDRRRTTLLLRSVVIATTAYLVLGGGNAVGWDEVSLVALFALSNVALTLAPARIFWTPHFGPLLLLADTGVIVLAFTWSEGVSQGLLIAYFLTLFLITAGETIGQVAIGAALIGCLYGYWVWVSNAPVAAATAWVPVPFFLFVGVFYASLIEQLKRERQRRVMAEDQNRHLRLLLDLADTFSQGHPRADFVAGLGRFVEAACPDLDCRLTLAPEVQAGSEGAEEAERQVGEDGERVKWRAQFPLDAHGRRYGTLSVRKAGSRQLSDQETWLCRMVAHAAAGALYAAEQARASQSAAQAKEQFLAAVSHEFRTPLHVILGYLEVLAPEDSREVDADVRVGVERMRVHVNRLHRLLEDLLSLAEIRCGETAVRVERVHLGALADEMAVLASGIVAGKPVDVSTEVAADAVELWSDGAKLRSVLSCLIGNAAKFTAAGRVSLSISRDAPGWVRFAIDDTGVGMARSELSLALDDFRQADGSLTRRYGGLGIGLPLASEMVELLGGTMAIESEAGRGTSVRVTLPDSRVSSSGTP